MPTSLLTTSPRSPAHRLILQPRDRQIISAAYRYRLLTSDHIRQLFFSAASLRAAQARLRALHDHGYLERLFVQAILGGLEQPAWPPRQPIYTLGKAAVPIVAADLEDAESNLRKGIARRPSPLALIHHLTVAHLLVALEVACRDRGDVRLVKAEAETLLWAKLKKHGVAAGAVMPDGSFSLATAAAPAPLTFLVEIVRADIRGGNRRLREKLVRYTELHRAGFFREVFGIERLRSVLIATTSSKRAEHFRQSAMKLVHGRNLFWFGVFERKDGDGRLHSTFTPENVLSLPWQTLEQGSLTLLDALKPSPST
jgi:hypothetical protein